MSDAPYTKAVTEALTAEKPKRKSAEPVAADVIYISREIEPSVFEIMDIRPARRDDRRLVWNVPAEIAERFARHHHVVTGRVVPSDANI